MSTLALPGLDAGRRVERSMTGERQLAPRALIPSAPARAALRPVPYQIVERHGVIPCKMTTMLRPSGDGAFFRENVPAFFARQRTPSLRRVRRGRSAVPAVLDL